MAILTAPPLQFQRCCLSAQTLNSGRWHWRSSVLQRAEWTCQDLVIQGIKECVQHHSSRRTKKIVVETLMKNISTACLFKIEKDKINVSNGTLQKLLGISKRQLTGAKSRLKDILSENISISPLVRKVRKDFIQIMLEPCAFDFLWDGTYTRLDTKQGLATVTDPRNGQEIVVHKRI